MKITGYCRFIVGKTIVILIFFSINTKKSIILLVLKTFETFFSTVFKIRKHLFEKWQLQFRIFEVYGVIEGALLITKIILFTF